MKNDYGKCDCNWFRGISTMLNLISLLICSERTRAMDFQFGTRIVWRPASRRALQHWCNADKLKKSSEIVIGRAPSKSECFAAIFARINILFAYRCIIMGAKSRRWTGMAAVNLHFTFFASSPKWSASCSQVGGARCVLAPSPLNYYYYYHR